MRRRQNLRKAFVTTVATLSAVAAAGCTSQVSIDCDHPSANCGQGGNSAGSSSSGFTPPTDCPEQNPFPGAECVQPGLECQYVLDAHCEWSETATCGEDGRWSVVGADPGKCFTPVGYQCPWELPLADTPCYWPADAEICVYDGLSCPVEALCDDGKWQVWETDCDPPPPNFCYQQTTAQSCAESGGACEWQWPGCGDNPLSEASCHPTTIDCSNGFTCPSGTSCQEVSIDPCVYDPCDACGAQVSLCVPDA